MSMEFPKVYEKHVVINSRDVDGRGRCKASALLGYLQDASAEHTMLCGCDRSVLLKRYHVFWMLTRIRLRLDQPVKWLDQLVIRTGHRGGKGVFLYRDYELLANGRPVGAAAALWVLPDIDTRKLLNVSTVPIPELDASAGGLEPNIKRIPALHAPDSLAPVEERLMRYSDSDVNGHVNNTKYADFCCDAVKMERLPDHTFLSGLEITYHEECLPGEVLVLSAGEQEGAWFIHGAGENGTVRFDGRLLFAKQ